ncbi:MAG: hypothetical protein methR_P0623 [Methyloprofundus sp.]|nr:MAG: hypothetical protein methR_P0623 [Methyloprofundus sp.]
MAIISCIVLFGLSGGGTTEQIKYADTFLLSSLINYIVYYKAAKIAAFDFLKRGYKNG